MGWIQTPGSLSMSPFFTDSEESDLEGIKADRDGSSNNPSSLTVLLSGLTVLLSTSFSLPLQHQHMWLLPPLQHEVLSQMLVGTPLTTLSRLQETIMKYRMRRLSPPFPFAMSLPLLDLGMCLIKTGDECGFPSTHRHCLWPLWRTLLTPGFTHWFWGTF